jgi:S1-C subfamily serine protease
MRPARALAAAVVLGGGCASAGKGVADPGAKLRQVGLEAVSAAEARLPPGEAERFLPCRVIPGFPNPPVPEHPAGYLIVAVEGRPAASREEILAALGALQPGEWLKLTFRRNPHVGAPAEWYEMDVPVRIR